MTKKVIGIRFKKAGKIYYFDPLAYDIQKDQLIIVDTARGKEMGQAVIVDKEIEEEELTAPLKPIVRIASQEDMKVAKENEQLAIEAMKIFEEKIQQHGLAMNPVDTEYTFDRNKLLFYFTANNRIDFRELVKDLALIFRTRIELRQIGVRDEAKMLGGLGCCGKPLCCSTWLGDFQPVSIKMAKDQNLSLNPTKISGVCGRLFCCLKYEHDNYKEILSRIPDEGTKVVTPDGKGVVKKTYALEEKVMVHVDTGDDVLIETYALHEIKPITKPKNKQRENNKNKVKDSSKND